MTNKSQSGGMNFLLPVKSTFWQQISAASGTACQARKSGELFAVIIEKKI
jgi:hypothetical protein